MNIKVLEDLGFSDSEIEIYGFLLESGSTKVGPIIDKSNLASSVVHRALNSLKDKGLINYIKKGLIKYYQAEDPKILIEFIENKKNEVLDLVKELEIKKIPKEKQEAEIFEGIKGITSLLYELIKEGKEEDEYLFFTVNVEEENEEIQTFFRKYDTKRKQKALIVKGLASKNLKSLFKGRNLKMKFTDYPIPSNISICNNKVAIFSWGDKPIGYLISSKQISKMFTDLFHSVWGIAK